MQKADFNCTFVFYIPTFPNSLSRHRISLWPPGSSEGNEQPVAKVSLPMGLLPPDTVSFHLLNWKTVKSSLILWWCLGGDNGQQRHHAESGREHQSQQRGSLFLWGRSCRASSHGWEGVRQQLLLSDWRDGSLCFSCAAPWVQPATLNLYERQTLGPVREKAFEMYTATSLIVYSLKQNLSVCCQRQM